MTEDQITALAREYAEEVKTALQMCYSEPLSDKIDYLLQGKQMEAEKVIHFLLRRFCLVEKEAFRKEYHEIKLGVMDKFCVILNCVCVILSVVSIIANAAIHRYYWCFTFAVLALCNSAAAFAVYRTSHKKTK